MRKFRHISRFIWSFIEIKRNKEMESMRKASMKKCMLVDAKEKAMFQIFTSAYKMHYMNNFEDLTEGIESEKELNILNEYFIKSKSGFKYFFIVINPREDVELERIIDKMNKTLNKCYIGHYLYSYEQRGVTEDEIGKGIHVNLLFKTTKYKRPCEIRREFYNTWKHLVGNTRHICLRRAMRCDNFVNYIHGNKKDPKKMESVNIDRIWRSELKLENTYENFDWLNKINKSLD